MTIMSFAITLWSLLPMLYCRSTNRERH